MRSKIESLLPYCFLVSGVILATALFPFLATLASADEFSMTPGSNVSAIIFSSVSANVILCALSFSAAILAFRKSKYSRFVMIVASSIFIVSWWSYSGLFVEDSEFLTQVWRRFFIWPQVSLQIGDIWGFVRIVLNDYLSFIFYHSTVVYLLITNSQDGK